MILIDKHANHQPLNRQSEQYEREGPVGPFSDAGELVREYGLFHSLVCRGQWGEFAHPARAS